MVKYLKQLPNILTFVRIGLIPIFVLLLQFEYNFVAMIVFIVAAITDYFDGFIARKFSAISDFGKLTDPIADKILVMAALVMLVGMRSDTYAEPWVAAWMVVVILARETWVTGLRTLAASRGLVLPAGGMGKIKSFIQMLAICFLIFHDPLHLNITELNISAKFSAQFIGEQLLLISVLFSIWSAVDYSICVFSSYSEDVESITNNKLNNSSETNSTENISKNS